MADYSQTVSNRINCFGQSPTTKWGVGAAYTMTWGVSLWGEGTESLVREYERQLSETVTIDSALELSVAWYREPNMGSLSFDFETSNESLQTANGYYYVFIQPSSNAEDRNLSSYTEVTSSAAVYTSGSAASIIWS